MSMPSPKTLILPATLLIAAAAIAYWALAPQVIQVETAQVSRGAMEGSVEADGITRVLDPWTVSAPISGVLGRPEVQEGDAVTQGETVVATLRPTEAQLLDARGRAAAQAAVAEATAAVDVARARLSQSEETLAYLQAQLDKIHRLVERGATTQAALEAAQRDVANAERAHQAAQSEYILSTATLSRASAELQPPEGPGGDGGCCLQVRAPVSGTVLAILEPEARPVPLGTPLLTIGDLGRMGIEADVLSTDAVQIAPGAPARITGWGGREDLQASVNRIDPMGRTRLSALGVEEQRVVVHLDLQSPPDQRVGLGDRFHVRVRIRLWSAEDVLQMPVGALFRQGTDWAVYRVVEGRARLTPIRIGRMTDQDVEVLEGLAEGDALVLYPGDEIAEGTRVAAMGAGG